MAKPPDLDHPWRWLAFRSVWPVFSIVLVCFCWALRGTNVNLLDAIGASLIVFAFWDAGRR